MTISEGSRKDGSRTTENPLSMQNTVLKLAFENGASFHVLSFPIDKVVVECAFIVAAILHDELPHTIGKPIHEVA